MHERYKTSASAGSSRSITEELEIPRLLPLVSTTFSREDVDRGLEPDESFLHCERWRESCTWDRIDLDIDPPPTWRSRSRSHGACLTASGFMRALGVPEIWRFDGVEFKVLLLGADRNDTTYRQSRGDAVSADE